MIFSIHLPVAFLKKKTSVKFRRLLSFDGIFAFTSGFVRELLE